MLYALLSAVSFCLTAVALYYFFRSGELDLLLRQSTEAWREREEEYTSELAKLEKIRHIPDIIERARKSKADVEAKLSQAQERADEIVRLAVAEAREQSLRLRTEGEKELEALRTEARVLLGDAEALRAEAREALGTARLQGQALLSEAQMEAKELASQTRKDAKTKRERAEAALNQATIYALDISSTVTFSLTLCHQGGLLWRP